jgi:MFS family permease
MAKTSRQPFPRAFWQMCIGALLFFLSFNLMIAELPEHLRQIGGAKYLGWIISSFSIFALLARPLSGLVTDVLGRKWAMMGGTAFCIVAGILYPISQVVWLFFMVRCLHGFSTGFAPTGFTAYTADVVPRERQGEALGWQGLFGNLGASVGYILGSLLVVWIGKNGMYYASSLLAIVALYLFSRLPEVKRKGMKREKGLLYLKAWQPALLMFLICAPLGAILTIMPDYTLFAGFSNKGLYLSVYIAFSLLVRIASGKLSDRLGRAVSTAIGTGFQTISLVLLLLFLEPWSFFLSAACYGIGSGFNAPGLFAWAGDTSTETTRGRALGMLFIALELGIISGSLFAGEFYNGQLPGFHAIFLFNLCCTLLAFGFSVGFIKKGATKNPFVKN